MSEPRSRVVSSFTLVKGSLIVETYAVFQRWDFSLSRAENLRRVKESNLIPATSANWLREIAKVLNRRFDPNGRDRPLVELAQAGCDRTIWKPLLLWHMTRDEFLLRDFLIHWLYPQYRQGAYRLHGDDLLPYLESLQRTRDIVLEGQWSEATKLRVASALLRMTVDFGLMTGKAAKEFTSYHLPEESFLYLVHAMAEAEPNAQRMVSSPDWHMYLMDAADVERELLRLHQYRRLCYEVAGSLAQLTLPWRSSAEYAKALVA